jgi:hypothetical protein
VLTCSTCPTTSADVAPWGEGINKCPACHDREKKEETEKSLTDIRAAFPSCKWELTELGSIDTENANGLKVSLIHSYSSWMLFTNVPTKKGMGENAIALVQRVTGLVPVATAA